jgi:hypothetical protein
MLPQLRTVDELAAELWPNWDGKRRRRWIYRQVEERQLPAIKVGRQLVFDIAAVRQWLTERTAAGGDTPAAAHNHEQANGD